MQFYKYMRSRGEICLINKYHISFLYLLFLFQNPGSISFIRHAINHTTTPTLSSTGCFAFSIIRQPSIVFVCFFYHDFFLFILTSFDITHSSSSVIHHSSSIFFISVGSFVPSNSIIMSKNTDVNRKRFLYCKS